MLLRSFFFALLQSFFFAFLHSGIAFLCRCIIAFWVNVFLFIFLFFWLKTYGEVNFLTWWTIVIVFGVNLSFHLRVMLREMCSRVILLQLNLKINSLCECCYLHSQDPFNLNLIYWLVSYALKICALCFHLFQMVWVHSLINNPSTLLTPGADPRCSEGV